MEKQKRSSPGQEANEHHNIPLLVDPSSLINNITIGRQLGEIFTPRASVGGSEKIIRRNLVQNPPQEK